MFEKLNNDYILISPKEVEKFVSENKNTIEIINAMEPHINHFFPQATLSLEVNEELDWTSETKLLLNVIVSEEIFFNGLLDNFNEIYKEIEPLIEEIFCPVVLFPEIENKKYDKKGNFSAINLIARTAYFNNDYEGSIEKEIVLRDIPKSQRRIEIIDYCKSHENVFISDIEDELRLDYDEIYDILECLEKEGLIKSFS